jgi:hypothetical protein
VRAVPLIALPLMRGTNFGNGLCGVDVFRLQTFWTLLYHERHARAFVQRAIAASRNGRKMYEHVFAILPLDKTKSFCGIKPLYSSCFFHLSSFLAI